MSTPAVPPTASPAAFPGAPQSSPDPWPAVLTQPPAFAPPPAPAFPPPDRTSGALPQPPDPAAQLRGVAPQPAYAPSSPPAAPGALPSQDAFVSPWGPSSPLAAAPVSPPPLTPGTTPASPPAYSPATLPAYAPTDTGTPPATPPAYSPATFPAYAPADPGATPALALRGLTKLYDGRPAVVNLNLDIPRGSMYGFVGPNGAGKTTTLSMATGMLLPDTGLVYVGGVDLWANLTQVKARIGVLPDGLRLFDRLSGQELLTYTGYLRGMDKRVVAERSAQLLEALGLAGDAKKAVADYSAGMTKKIALACAVLHAPDLLVLDEPFEAIDPVSARSIAEILGGFVSDGGTVILSSHVMDTVEKLCDHVAIIAAGQLRAAGTIAEVAAGAELEQRFFDLVGAKDTHAQLDWLKPQTAA